jgi:hypothetical protein
MGERGDGCAAAQRFLKAAAGGGVGNQLTRHTAMHREGGAQNRFSVLFLSFQTTDLSEMLFCTNKIITTQMWLYFPGFISQCSKALFDSARRLLRRDSSARSRALPSPRIASIAAQSIDLQRSQLRMEAHVGLDVEKSRSGNVTVVGLTRGMAADISGMVWEGDVLEAGNTRHRMISRTRLIMPARSVVRLLMRLPHAPQSTTCQCTTCRP